MKTYVALLFALALNVFGQQSFPNLAVKTNLFIGSNVVAGGVSISSNALVQIAQPFIGSTLYSFGTSHPQGVVAYPFTTNYIQVIGLLDSNFRYPNLLQSYFGFPTLVNNGVAGTSFRFNTNNSTFESAHISRLGSLLPLNWNGTLTLDYGFNDGYYQYLGNNFTTPYFQAYKAGISRALVDYFVSSRGVDSSLNPYTWLTTGTNFTNGVSTINCPFPVPSGIDTNRTYTLLTNVQFVSVILTNWNNAVVYFDQTTNAGTARVFANGVQKGSISSFVPFTTFSQPWGSGFANDSLVGAIVVKNLTGNTTLAITNLTGSTRILAIGRLPNSTPGKSIVVGSPPVTPQYATGRDTGALVQMGLLSRMAVQEFSNYPVYFADEGGSINPAEHLVSETIDPYHFNPSGHEAIANAFINAKKINQISGVSWQASRFGNLVGSEEVSIDGVTDNIKALNFKLGGVTRMRIALSTGGDTFVQTYNSSGAFLDNNVSIFPGVFEISNQLRFGPTGPTVRSGTGSPEGVVTAVQGSLFLRTDGGALTTLYVKTLGSGNTGWTAK